MSSETFSLFPKLPVELQCKIWEVALADSIPNNRVLFLSIYHRLHVAHHSCVTLGGEDAEFCGDVTRCAKFRDGDPSNISMFMTDGFFATSDDFPEPDDRRADEAIQRLSLVCIEARAAVLRRFPVVVRVHRGFFQAAKKGDDDRFWYQTRRARCHPAHDWIVITQVPDMSVGHVKTDWIGPSNRARHELLDSIFPGDEDWFAQFRRVLSSFERFAFVYVGFGRLEPEHFSDRAAEAIGMNMPATSDFNTLLLFQESRRFLYMWPDPGYWPEMKETGVCSIPDVLCLSAGGSDAARQFVDLTSEMSDAMRDYERAVDVHEVHSAPSDKYWVPSPKPLKLIGAFTPVRWIDDLGWGGISSDGVDSEGELSETEGNEARPLWRMIDSPIL